MIPVAILAGGLATRLRPVTEKVPKSLIEVADEPFVSHQLRLLRQQGISKVVLCIGYLGEMVQTVVGDGSAWGLDVRYSFDGERLLGTGGALRRALPLLGDRFFVMYGDSYLEGNYAEISEAHLAGGKLGLMTVLRNQNSWDKSNVRFSDGRIVTYDKVNRTADMQHIDWGLGVISAEAVRHRAEETAFDLADTYRELLNIDQLLGYEVDHRFYEIGSAEGIAETDRYLRQKTRQHC